MKRILLALMAIVCLAPVVFGASINLKFQWDPNTEPDMASYKLYRTDGTRTLISTYPHPPVFPALATITVPDGSSGTMTFVLTALDTSGNESGDSNVVSHPFDLKPPGAPINLREVP